jgi:hypothetical protein
LDYNNNVSLGSSGLEFKNLLLSGNATVGGTATMGGLVVDGDVVVASTVPRLILSETDVTNGNWDFRGSFGNLLIRSLNDDLSTAVSRLGIAAGGDISFYEDTGTTPKFFWDASAESLGIGTSSPTSPLHIKSATDVNVRFDDSGSSSYTWYMNDAQNLYIPNVQLASGHTFYANGQRKVDIDSSGNLLVGTTSPSSFQNNNSFVLRTSVGDAVINHVNGTVTGSGYLAFGYNGGRIGYISQSGTTAVLYNTSSDERLKENIADADDAGSKIDAIQVRKYDWKADGSHQDYGMIAQELLEVAPEAVSVPEDSEEMMGVDYSKLVPMLIKEIQSLRNRVAQLEE